ncbi:G-protein-coupled receptor family protein [Cavenderia fasciculata]|uniref:G-protein-coupled receptor family protein n=1 Tax=Cavenderia fasciculata TaxID=261658 RepID=F4PJX8_CACFS|nr:G-protein-coupled receptor family protein [Cavenderia fasciculata]EGG23902.1 G-protein-coupled receptor family protein [Cavenderia fasciculata]|eukprot:XP_004361753.1 G-protein-coupled receptor family protein [Cavenderia fasciculata]
MVHLFTFYSYLFLIFCFYISITIAQQPVLKVDPTATCTPYIGDPPNKPVCNDRLINPGSIYSNQTNTQANKIQEVSEINFLLGAISCGTNQVQNALCTKYLGECYEPVNQTLSQNIALESQLCKSACLTITASCNNPMVADLVDCNDASVFPEAYSIYDLSPFGGDPSYQVPCTNSLLIAGPNQTQEYCPFPLFYVNRSDPQYDKDNGYTFVGSTSCLVPCPVPIYTNSTWEGLYKMSSVMSSVSFVCISFNIFTFGILARDHNKFTISLLCFSIAILLMNFVDIIYAAKGHINLFCPNPGRYAQQDDIGCSFTGSLFHLGVVGSILYWVTMSMQLWTSIKRIDIKILQPKYSIIAVSIIQIILLVIPLSLKAVKAGGGAVSCWVSGKWIQNGVYWFPVSVALAVGIFFVFLVIKEIYVIVRNIHHDKRFIRLQIKPFLCVVNDDEYNANAVHYLECLLQGGDPNECTVDGPPYFRFFFFYFLLRMFGIFVFLLYGLTSKSKQIWLESFICQYPPIKSRLQRMGVFHSSSGYTTDGGKKPPSHTTYDQSRGNTAASSDVDSIELNSFQSP